MVPVSRVPVERAEQRWVDEAIGAIRGPRVRGVAFTLGPKVVPSVAELAAAASSSHPQLEHPG